MLYAKVEENTKGVSMHRLHLRLFLSITLFLLSEKTMLAHPQELSHDGCCHEEGNIFLILDKETLPYTQARYNLDPKTEEYAKRIRKARFVVQHNHTISYVWVELSDANAVIFIKGREQIFSKVIENCFAQGTLILAKHLTQNDKIMSYLRNEEAHKLSRDKEQELIDELCLLADQSNRSAIEKHINS